MKLIGVLLSPFVRRVAISLNFLELRFELEEVFVFGEPDTVRSYNPLGRIPILALEDGTNLVESAAILDEIDHMVRPERRLVPNDNPLRRRVVRTVAIALACAEKAQWAFYEGRVRPAEKISVPWSKRNDEQVLGGLEHLNVVASELAQGTWIAGTPGVSQADITTAVAFTFAKLSRPHLGLAERFPHLSDFTDRCECLPAFLKSPLPDATRLQGWLSRPFVE